MKRKRPPLDQVEDYFDNDGNPFATYTVDPWGRIRQHAEEIERPWSQGWGGLGGLDKLETDVLKDRRKLPEWWLSAHLDPPNTHWGAFFDDMFPVGTPNDRSVSIEFIQWQPGKVVQKKYQGKRNYKLTLAQYLIGNLLTRDIAIRHGKEYPVCPDDRALIGPYMQMLGHEDCDPWGRGKPKTGGWDPGALRPKGKRFCWECFLTLDFNNCDCKCVIPTPEMPKWAE
jgi:hypothetical protein